MLGGRGAIEAKFLLNSGHVSPDGGDSPRPRRQEPATVFALNFAGVQDDAPLFATSIQDVNLNVTSGLDFGPSTQARSAGPDGFTGSDRGDEFNVGGFDTTSLAAAISAGDYLTSTTSRL